MGDRIAEHFRAVIGVLVNQVCGNNSGLDDVGLGIDVLEEQVQGLDPLVKTFRDPLPLCPGQHPRDDIERNQPLFGVGFSIDRKRNADPAEQMFGFRLAEPQHVLVGIFQPGLYDLVGGAAFIASGVHFVKGADL